MKRFTRRHRKGLTLIEIIIVIALIAGLAAVLINQFGGQLTAGQEDTARIFVTSSLSAPLTSYRIHMGNYPTSEQGLTALKDNPTGSPRWRGPYYEKAIPTDPWGNEYKYRFPGQKNPNSYDLWSMGPDATDGTADDIGNWEDETTG